MEFRMKAAKTMKLFGIFFAALLFSGVLITPAAIADETVLYFVRHAEKQNQLTEVETDIGQCYTEDCSEYKPGKTCCTEELSDLGLLRREELADWFAKREITPELTHVFSSHKLRTWQTVEMIAEAAEYVEDVERLGPAECLDDWYENHGDECESGCESGKDSITATVDAIWALPQGSRVLIGQHSGTIYLIMEELGIDTSDDRDFPRDSKGKVAGYNNLWKVKIAENDEIEVERIVLDLSLEKTN